MEHCGVVRCGAARRAPLSHSRAARSPAVCARVLAVAAALLATASAQSSKISKDCVFLKQFYTAANVQGRWQNSSGWDPADATHYDCCLWAGVTCEYPRRYAGMATPRVIALNLTGFGLKGTISSAVQGLTRLELLDLSHNALKGDIEPLVYLGGETRCEDTPAQGQSREDMFHRSCDRDAECRGGKCLFGGGLREIWLDDNLLSGTIPLQISMLHKTLEILDLSANKLQGTLPATMGVLQQLKELNLYFNQLVGTIPPQMGLLRKMRFLHLGVNHLSGTIPEQLGGMARLEQLDLSMNHFNGSVPSTLGVLTSPRPADCDRPGGSCFGLTLRNLSLHADHCKDMQMTTWHIQGYKQPCETGAPDARYQCKSCEMPYPSAGRTNTQPSPAADCHAGLPPFPAAPMLYATYPYYPWGPDMPDPVTHSGVGPSLRLLVIHRCTRNPSLYARPPPPTPPAPPPPTPAPPPTIV
jgi:hypothetical protein